MEYITLNNQVTMPILGLGTYQLKGESGIETIKNAINLGYTLIDTAQMYQNEREVGIAVKESNVNRKNLFITTKICTPNTTYEKTEKAIDISLKNLQTDYIDLLLIHEPYDTSTEMYKAFEKAYKTGKIRAIGISNFNESEYLDFIGKCSVIPTINQVECHILYNKKELQNTMKKYGTVLMGYSPFAQGNGNLFVDNDIMSIGKKYNKTSSQVMLRYLIQRGIPTVPKASSVERLKENLDVFNFTLNDNDVQIINSKNQNKSFFGWDWVLNFVCGLIICTIGKGEIDKFGFFNFVSA